MKLYFINNISASILTFGFFFISFFCLYFKTFSLFFFQESHFWLEGMKVHVDNKIVWWFSEFSNLNIAFSWIILMGNLMVILKKSNNIITILINRITTN